MKKTSGFAKTLSAMICLVLIAAMALTMTACQTSDENGTSSTDSTASVASTVSEPEVTELGEGKTQFSFTVVHKDGSEKAYLIKTDETTVGAALVKEGLISGDEGKYGLYVTTVDGETLDYDKDQMFWAFYIGDTMAQTGVDQTDITADASYSLKAQK